MEKIQKWKSLPYFISHKDNHNFHFVLTLINVLINALVQLRLFNVKDFNVNVNLEIFPYSSCTYVISVLRPFC